VRTLLAVIVVSVLAIACSGGPQSPEGAAPPAVQAGGLVPDDKPAPPVRWSEATIPAGTALGLALVEPLSSETNRPGDRFRGRMVDGIVQGNRVVLPGGSIVDGKVLGAVAAGRGAGRQGGTLIVQFERITTPFGATADLAARVLKTGVAIQVVSDGVITGGGPGRSVVLPPEAPLTVVLEKPLQIKVRE
jgi:hypothetical protein